MYTHMITNRLRLIAGKFRGQKLSFPNVGGLRPTKNQIRETLFNWLAPVIQNASCLDLFAGSGALGFEALSRGAKNVVFVDNSKTVITALSLNQNKLQITNAVIRQQDSLDFLKHSDLSFDIIFLDPPFESHLLEKTWILLQDKNLLNPSGFIYVEIAVKTSLPTLPKNWKIYREKKTGNVNYYLINFSA